MNDQDTPQTLSKAIKRNAYQISHDESESNETANHCTMFILGAVAFGVGFWGVTCLVSAVLKDGPVTMLSSLAKAVTGF